MSAWRGRCVVGLCGVVVALSVFALGAPVASAATGKVSVSTPSGTGSSSGPFTVGPGIALSKAIGRPTKTVTVSGAGFGAREAVDVYFDATDEAVASASATGTFSATFAVPASATPGAHQITAVGRHSGLSAQATFTVSAGWAQFHYGPTRKGWNPFENVLSPANVSQIDKDWSFTTGNVVVSSPAAAGGRVFVGSTDDNVYALDASSGAKLWSFSAGGAVSSSPAVANGVVYVGSNDGSVYALKASSGAKLWSFSTGSGVYSAPAVVNGVVYVGSGDNNVYALDASSGAKLWSFATGGQIISSSPAVSGGVVYVGSNDGNMYALDAATGAKRWSVFVGGGFSSPALANGRVYFGSADGNVSALNATTGARLWNYTTGGFVFSSPAVANGAVYVGSGDDNLYALNASTGAKLWSFGTGGAVESSPALANGVAYVGSYDGNVYALDAASGAELWSYTTGGHIEESSPAVSNGMVYIGSDDHKLYAFGLAGGMASTVAAAWQPTAAFTTVQKLTVNHVPINGSVTVFCAGRGCPFAHRTVRRVHRVAALAGLLRGAHLRPGTRIRITITAAHLRGRVLVFVIRSSQRPVKLRGCSPLRKGGTLRCA